MSDDKEHEPDQSNDIPKETREEVGGILVQLEECGGPDGLYS